jgi:hypothetical protein
METEAQLSTEDQAKLEVLRKIAKDAFDSLGRGEGKKIPFGGAREYVNGIVARIRERYAQPDSEVG